MDQHVNTTENALAEQWLERAMVARDSHYRQGKVLKKLYTTIGIAICVITAIVGSSIFASISNANNTASNIVFGILSLVALVLAGLQTFLNLPERSEKHRATAIRFSSLVRKLEMIINSKDKEWDVARRSLEEVQKEWDNINLEHKKPRFSSCLLGIVLGTDKKIIF